MKTCWFSPLLVSTQANDLTKISLQRNKYINDNRLNLLEKDVDCSNHLLLGFRSDNHVIRYQQGEVLKEFQCVLMLNVTMKYIMELQWGFSEKEGNDQM